MPECDGCGAHVSTGFIRVFATNEGDIRGCPRCTSKADLFDTDAMGSPGGQAE